MNSLGLFEGALLDADYWKTLTDGSEIRRIRA